MTKRKRFIRTGQVMKHDVLFIGNFALPLHFTIAVGIVAFLAYFTTMGILLDLESPVGAVMLWGLLILIVWPAVYWIWRGLSWVVRVTRKINGGRVES